MKIAVFSDIHSNPFALEAILEDIKKESPDKIISLGDVITDGPNSSAILNTVKNFADTLILGNREKTMLKGDSLKKDFLNDKPLVYSFHELSKDDLAYLKTLKDHFFMDVEGYKILFTHGEKFFQRDKSIYRMYDGLLDAYDFDICVYGHTHEYMDKTYRAKRFINPGAVGQPVDSNTYKYCIIEISKDRRVNVRFKQFEVKKNFTEFKNYYEESNYYKDNQIWSYLILNSVRDSVDYPCYFMDMVNKEIADKGKLSASEYNKIYKKLFEEFREKKMPKE